jgi:hypothetical protein
MLTVARCTQAVVWIQVMGSHELLSEVEDQVHWVRGKVPTPRELLRILAASASRNQPIRGMCYSRRSWAYIQATGAGRNAFAARTRLEMQGTGMAAHVVVHGVYAEVHHKTSSAAHSSSVLLCGHTANGERLMVRSSGVSKMHLALVACMGGCDVQVSQEVLLVGSVLEVLDDARAVVLALDGWPASGRQMNDNGSPSVVAQRRVGFLAA